MTKRKRAVIANKKSLDERVELRLTKHEKAAYQDAADRQGISLSHWLRLAARTVLKDHAGRVELGRLKD